MHVHGAVSKVLADARNLAAVPRVHKRPETPKNSPFLYAAELLPFSHGIGTGSIGTGSVGSKKRVKKSAAAPAPTTDQSTSPLAAIQAINPVSQPEEQLDLLAQLETVWPTQQSHKAAILSKDDFTKPNVPEQVLWLIKCQQLGFNVRIGLAQQLRMVLSNKHEESKQLSNPLYVTSVLEEILHAQLQLTDNTDADKEVFMTQLVGCLYFLTPFLTKVYHTHGCGGKGAGFNLMNDLVKLIDTPPYATCVDIVQYVARIVSKASCNETYRQHMMSSKTDAVSRLVSGLRCYSEDNYNPEIIPRLAYALGSLICHELDKGNSAELGRHQHICTDITNILQIVQHDDKATTNVLRIIGNLSVNNTCAAKFMQDNVFYTVLMRLLKEKDVSQCEDLVLNMLQCVTNLSFYNININDSNPNLFTQNTTQLLPRLSTLLLYNHPYCILECSKALGNLSNLHGVRNWMISNRVDEAVVILLDHSDWDVLHAVYGIMVNFSADTKHLQVFAHHGAIQKVVQRLDEFVMEPHREALSVAESSVKILHNLVAHDFFAAEDTDFELVGAIRCILQSLSESLHQTMSANGKASDLLTDLLMLTHNLLELMTNKWDFIVTPVPRTNKDRENMFPVSQNTGCESKPYTCDEFEELPAPTE